MFNAKNTNMQGNIGLGIAIAFFTSRGMVVSLPLNDSQKYDLICDDGKELHRVQVKTTSQMNKPKTHYSVKLETCSHNFSEKFDNSSSDILFVLTASGTKYCIPTSAIIAKAMQVLGSEFDKYIGE